MISTDDEHQPLQSPQLPHVAPPGPVHSAEVEAHQPAPTHHPSSVSNPTQLVNQEDMLAEDTSSSATPSNEQSMDGASHEGDRKRTGQRMQSHEKLHTAMAEQALTSAEVRTTEDEQVDDTKWDPLQSPSRENSSDASAPVKGVLLPSDAEEEEGDVTDLNGRLEDRVETTPNAAKRASHLRLDLKSPSPPSWELIGPSSDEGRKEAKEFYSNFTSRKYNPVDSAMNTRRLIPKSSYYYGPPTGDTGYGTAPVGHIGVHHPREILRIERDYSGGEIIQFTPSYPLELEGRITPTQFLESINLINEVLISAHSLRHSVLDNVLAVFTLQLSRLIFTSHYDKEMGRLRRIIEDLNAGLYNPVGLNILWPRNVAFLFLEIEYY